LVCGKVLITPRIAAKSRSSLYSFAAVGIEGCCSSSAKLQTEGYQLPGTFLSLYRQII
jgi:hypothetical protein